MANVQAVSEKEAVYPDLSYKIVGAAYTVNNELGWGLSEVHYQRALAVELDKLGIRYSREVYIPLKYKDKKISRFYADFVVEDKILIELKVVHNLGYVHAHQVLNYLESAGIRLGILVYFTRDGVKYKRILNPNVST